MTFASVQQHFSATPMKPVTDQTPHSDPVEKMTKEQLLAMYNRGSFPSARRDLTEFDLDR